MRALVVLALFLLMTSCAAPPPEPPPDPAAVQSAIEAVNASFMEAFNQQDASALSAFYTEDAVSMPPNAEAVRGRPAIEERNTSDFALLGLTGLKLETQSVEVFKDSAVELGSYSIQVAPPGMPEMEDRGKYLVLWKKEAEGWKLHWDIWNSNLPLPEPDVVDTEQEQ